MSAADLLRRGQAYQAAQFPATIVIGSTSYSAGTSGEKREPDLINGGWLRKASIAFWLPLSAFGGTPPAERTPVTHGSKSYVIASTVTDPASATITLRCETPDE